MVNLPVIDMVRKGQNIGRLRKQGAALQVRMDDILVTSRMGMPSGEGSGL